MKHRILLSVLFLLYGLTTTSTSFASTGDKTGYAGSEACKDCHEDRYNEFQKSIHGNKLNPKGPAAEHGCETCHGPRAAHINNPDSTSADGKKGVDPAICLNCHTKGKVVLWSGSQHQRRNVVCANCHNPHGSNPKMLIAATQPEVCTQCHKNIRNQLLKPSHHPIREGKVTCTDCHNPHGTVANKLIAANTVNEKCYECHAEKRGPFLWEHAPVTEDCTTCHTPHGSTVDKLLVARAPLLCQRCHSNSRHPGTLYAPNAATPGVSVYAGVGNRAYYRACLNCHNQVHGSNHPSGKALAR